MASINKEFTEQDYETQEDIEDRGQYASIWSFKTIFAVLYQLFVVEGYTEIPKVDKYCWKIVRKHIYDITKEDDFMGYIYDDWKLISTSSDYTIACQRLGNILDPNAKSYASKRMGSRMYVDAPWWRDTPVSEDVYASDYYHFRDLLRVLELLNTLKSCIPSISSFIDGTKYY